MPLVSVVLLTRGQPSLLAITLECYRLQSYPNRELVVVDDGDRAPASRAGGGRVRGHLMRVPTGMPLGGKLTVGSREARGTYIQKMDDDDYYAPKMLFLATMVEAVLAAEASLSQPTVALVEAFLFFDLARWEVRQMLPWNAPGATLFFPREGWEEHPISERPCRDEAMPWDFYRDQLRLGGRDLRIGPPRSGTAASTPWESGESGSHLGQSA